MGGANVSTKCVLFYWVLSMRGEGPQLSMFGSEFVSLPMGYTASERQFKVAKCVTDGRFNLKLNNVKSFCL